MSEETTELTRKDDVLNIAEIQKAADSMSPSGVEMVTNYYDFGVGEEIKLLPLAVARIDKLNPSKEDWDNKRENEDKPMTDAIRFLNVTDGEFYISAAAVLVSSLKDAARENETSEIKKFFAVKCVGEKESGKGKYQVFSIQTLV